VDGRILKVAALVAASSGCSFIFSEGPPADHAQMPYFDCVSTYGLPVADGFFASSGLISGISTLRQSKEEFARQNKDGNRNQAAGILLGMGVISGASAVYGIVQATRCTNAKAALRARFFAPRPGWPATPPGWHPTLPAPVPPPPVGPAPSTLGTPTSRTAPALPAPPVAPVPAAPISPAP
jgi:hypothetical protein